MIKQFYLPFLAIIFGISLQAQNTTTGSVFYHDFEPISDAIMSVNSQSTTTNASGEYEIEWTDASVAYLVGEKPADYTKDINMLDVVAMRNYILGADGLENVQRIAADVNDSGSITTFDIVLLMKLILGLESTIPTTFPNLIFLPEECNNSSSIFCGAYADLNTDNDNIQNFYGIKKGDVVRRNVVNSSLHPVFTLEQAGCNDAVNIQLVATEYDSEIGGVQFSMSWNANKFDFSAIEVDNSITNINNYNVNEAEGWITFAYLGNSGNANIIEEGDVLFTLTLAPVGSYEGEQVIFENAPTEALAVTWSGDFVETTFNDVTLTENVDGITDANITIDNASNATVNDGVITVEDISGGVAPYSILLVETNTTGEVHTNLAAGNYTLEITDATGCTWLRTVTVSTAVGLFDVVNNDWLMLSQNPIQQGQQAQIKILSTQNNEAKVLIINALGQVVAQQKETITTNSIIDLPAISTAGMYWVLIENGDQLARLPLVIQ